MPGVIATSPRFKFFDNNGDPAAGYLLYTYSAGTTTPATTWQDQGQATANTNPIELDANGECLLWLTRNVEYKFVLKTAAGATIRTTDDIGGSDFGLRDDLAAPTGSSIVGHIASGAGAVATTAQRKLRERVSLFDYMTAGQIADSESGTATLDLSAAVTSAQAAIVSGGTIELPPGDYKFNIDMPGTKRFNLVGAGVRATTVRPYTAGTQVLSLGGNTSWKYVVISDLTFIGTSAANSCAVQFGRTVYQSNDEYAGRVRFVNVEFTGFEKHIRKLYGNIGNRFDACQFSTATMFHYYAIGSTSPVMHAGADEFNQCHFDGAVLASFYIDSPTSGSGQLIFNGGIFESNPGFAFFVKEFNQTWSPGIIFNGTWFENNATNANTTIDSTVYTTGMAYFRKAGLIKFTGAKLGRIELTETVVEADACNTDSLTLVKNDAYSYLHGINADVNSSQGYNFPVTSFSRVVASAGNSVSRFLTNPRNQKTHGVTPLQSYSFAEGAVAFVGTSSKNGTVVADGLLFDSCNEISIAAGEEFIPSSIPTPNTNKYQVVSVDLKLVSGNAVTVGVYYNQTYLPSLSFDATRWTTFISITNTFGVTTNQTALHFVGPASGTSYIRMSAFQIVEFDTLQDAMLFANSGLLAVSPTYPRTFYAPSIPTTGTWAVGDRAINSAPAVGQPKSWVCTVAGSPGTWTSEGNL